MELGNELSPGHGAPVDGSVACCRRTSGNTRAIDCPTCLEEEWASIKESLLPQEMEIAIHILTVVRGAEEQGVRKSHLEVCCIGFVQCSFEVADTSSRACADNTCPSSRN